MPFKAQELDAAAYREALTALADREVQHRQLAAIRLELERLRLLLERVSKRERLKRESERCLLTCIHPKATFIMSLSVLSALPLLLHMRAYVCMMTTSPDMPSPSLRL